MINLIIYPHNGRTFYANSRYRRGFVRINLEANLHFRVLFVASSDSSSGEGGRRFTEIAIAFMAGRYDRNPYEEEEDVNPFAVSWTQPTSRSSLNPLSLSHTHTHARTTHTFTSVGFVNAWLTLRSFANICTQDWIFRKKNYGTPGIWISRVAFAFFIVDYSKVLPLSLVLLFGLVLSIAWLNFLEQRCRFLWVRSQNILWLTLIVLLDPHWLDQIWTSW